MLYRQIASLLFLFAGIVSATEPLVAVADYFRPPMLRNLRMSPDGKYLAVVVPDASSEKLVILDRATLAPLTQFTFKENQSVGFYAWVNRERIVVSPNIKLGSLDQPVATGELYAGNADGSKKLQLLGAEMKGENQAYGFRIDRIYKNDSKEILLTKGEQSHFPSSFRLNTYTGQLTKVIKSPVRNGHLLFDESDVARLAIGSSDQGEQIVMYRHSQDDDWQQVSQSRLGQGSLTPIKMASDGVHFWALSDEEATTTGLYLINGKTMARTLLYRHAEVDIQETISDAADRELIAVQITADYPRTIYLSETHPEAQLRRALAASFKNGVVRIVDQSSDQQWLTLYVSSDRDPGAYYLYHRASQQIKPLLQLMPWIKPEQQAAREAIVVSARDGVPLRGYLTLPNGRERDLPLIIIPHGGPHGIRDEWRFDREAQLFANRGYAVVQINYRGSGGYGREFLASGFGHWGTTMQDDLTDTVRWAIKEKIADANRVCIYGASYGGYSALMSPIKEPDLYRCAVAYVGVYSIERLFTTGDASKSSEGVAYLRQVHGDDRIQQRAQSPSYNVDKLKTPIFIVHGEKDIRAHYSHFTELREALDQRKYPYEYLTKPKEAHGFYDLDNNIELYEKMLAFFDRHIGAGSLH